MPISIAKYTTILEYILTVLITKFVFDCLMYFLPVVQSTQNAYYDVLIGMGLTIIVFYPVYGIIHKSVEKISKIIIKTDKRKRTGEYVSVLIGFFVIITLIFIGMMKIKKDINVLQQLLLLF